MFDPAWEAVHRDRQWGRWPDINFVRFAMKTYGAVPDRSAVRFLELGCGSGAQVAFLAEEGFSVIGVDASHSAILSAQELRSRRKVAIAAVLVTMDIMEFARTPWPMDCILDICTLQHLPDSDAAAIIAKARGWLKPGGRFFSVMLDWAKQYEFPVPVYGREAVTIYKLFAGYNLRLGTQTDDRSDGASLAHWIIEAQVPA